MKTPWARTIAPTLLAATLTATTAAAGALTPFKVFDSAKFEQNLRAELDGKTIGYAYAIYQNGVLLRAGGNGKAVVPSWDMTADKRATLMSMSKTITAVAFMKALEIARARGDDVSILSPIGPYLPPSWARGRDVSRMTFKDLLRHESGLRAVDPAVYGDPDLYVNLRHTIARGAVMGPFNLSAYGHYDYCNCNFTLLRVLIPRLLQDHDPFSSDSFLLDELMGGAATAQAYVDFVREELLSPVGIDASVVPTGPMPYTRFYNFANTSFYMPPDRTGMDAIRRTGAGYWYMSVKEFGAFLSRVRMGLIISRGSWALMSTNELGLYGVSDTTTAEHGGDYLTHNGGLTFPNPPPNDASNSGAHAAWMMFPNGVTAVLLHNADQVSLQEPQWILMGAFNQAFVTFTPS